MLFGPNTSMWGMRVSRKTNNMNGGNISRAQTGPHFAWLSKIRILGTQSIEAHSTWCERNLEECEWYYLYIQPSVLWNASLVAVTSHQDEQKNCDAYSSSCDSTMKAQCFALQVLVDFELHFHPLFNSSNKLTNRPRHWHLTFY